LKYWQQSDALVPRPFVTLQIGLTLIRLGKFEQGRAVLEKALKAARATRDYTLPRLLTRLAETYRVQGDAALGIPLLSEAIAIIEKQRLMARGLTMRQHMQVFERLRAARPYAHMVVAQCAAGKHDRALEYAERARGRALLDLLERGRVDPLDEAEKRARRRGDGQRLARITTLRRNLASADDEVSQSTSANDTEALVKARANRDALLGERMRLVRRLLPMGKPLDARAIQGSLEPNDRLLYFTMFEGGGVVFLVPPLGAETKSISLSVTPENLEKMIGIQRTLATRTRSLDAPTSTESVRPDPKLFQALIPADLWAELRKAKRVFIVADGLLHRLPFEMLAVDGRGTTWLEAGPPISYVLSGSMLAWCRQRREEQRGIDLPHEILALGGARFGDGLAPLPGSAREAKAVGSVTLLGDHATKEALFEAAPKARVIHLATHQIADERDSYGYSRLALTGGYLHLFDLFEHWRDHLNACELVVLSACETAKGPLQRDEGPYAMPVGFLYAGAPSVIGSLWNVDDASTAELFTDFYKRLAKGTPKLQAFTEARKALKKKYPSPYHWAAFVYIGDPR